MAGELSGEMVNRALPRFEASTLIPLAKVATGKVDEHGKPVYDFSQLPEELSHPDFLAKLKQTPFIPDSKLEQDWPAAIRDARDPAGKPLTMLRGEAMTLFPGATGQQINILCALVNHLRRLCPDKQGNPLPLAAEKKLFRPQSSRARGMLTLLGEKLDALTLPPTPTIDAASPTQPTAAETSPAPPAAQPAAATAPDSPPDSSESLSKSDTVSVEDAIAILGAERVVDPEAYTAMVQAYEKKHPGDKMQFVFPDRFPFSREELEAIRIRGGTLTLYPSGIAVAHEKPWLLGYDRIKEYPVTLKSLFNLFQAVGSMRFDYGQFNQLCNQENFASKPDSSDYRAGWIVEGPASDRLSLTPKQIPEYIDGINALINTNGVDVSVLNSQCPASLPTMTQAVLAMTRDRLSERSDGIPRFVWTSSPDGIKFLHYPPNGELTIMPQRENAVHDGYLYPVRLPR